MQECREEGHNSGSNPTPTGADFLAWCEKYREKHPDRVGIPLKLQEQYWIRAAKANEGGANLLDAINGVREARGQRPVKK